MRVDQRGQHLIGQLVPVGEIDDLDRAAVDRITEQQNVEVRVFGIRVDPRFGEIDRRKCFEIAANGSYRAHEYVRPVLMALIHEWETSN